MRVPNYQNYLIHFAWLHNPVSGMGVSPMINITISVLLVEETTDL